VFVIYSDQHEVLERFLFDVSAFPNVPEKETFTEFEGTLAEEGDDGTQLRISIVDVEEQLRATVRMLAYCGGKLGELPGDCTYTLAVELKDSADPPIGVCCSALEFETTLMDFSIRNLGYPLRHHYKQERKATVK